MSRFKKTVEMILCLHGWETPAKTLADQMYKGRCNSCQHLVTPRLFKFVLVSAVNVPWNWTVLTPER